MTSRKPRCGKLATLGAALIALGGCATAPDFDVPKDEAGPTLASISARIMCELADMVADKGLETYGNRIFLLKGDFQVEMQLNLTVNQSGGLAPSFTYMSGPFSFAGGANLSKSREQNFVHYSHYSMRDLAKQVGKYPKIQQCPAYDTNLAGEIGLRKAVDLALTAQNTDLSLPLTGTSGVFSGSVSFVVTKNLNSVGPTWMLKNFTGPGKLASVSEINTDKLLFAFAPGKDVGKPIGVYSTASNDTAAHALDQLNIIQLSNQLSGIRAALQ